MRLKTISFTLALLATVATSATAQLDKKYFNQLRKERVTSTTAINWRQFGPGMSGYNEELWCHPSDPKTVLMAPDMHVCYGSWDYAKSWHTLKDCDAEGYDMERVIEIAFSRQNPDFALALDRDGWVNRSLDRGRTWEQIVDVGKTMAELAVDPTNDNNWYIGAGDFFNVKDNHRSQKNPHGLIQKRSEYGFILKSTDKGKSWKKITKGLPEMVDVGRIVVDPRNPKNILAMTGHGLYRSTDEGLSWSPFGKGLPNNLPRDMVSHYDAKSKKYTLFLVEQSVYERDGNGSVTVKGGVFKSVDGGENWIDITGNLAVDMTKITSKSMRWMYARAIAHWFDIKMNEAYKEFPKYSNSIYTVFNRIRVNPLNPDEIYISANVKHDRAWIPGDMWRTRDGGKTWITIARAGAYWENCPDKEYWESRNNPTHANMKFAHMHVNIARTENIAGVRHIDVDCEGTLYAGMEQQTLRSTNGGDSWMQIDEDETAEGSGVWVSRGDSDLPGRYMLLETGKRDRILFCTGEHGLWESAPLGDYDAGKDAVGVRQIEGQVHAHGAHSVASVAVHPNDPNTIYILMFRQEHRGHLRRTTDGGKTWENISKAVDYNHPNISGNHVFQYSLMIDPKEPKNMYFCTIANAISEVGGGNKAADMHIFGVNVSYDGGYTWSVSNSGLPEGCSVNRLAMDHKNPSTLYAALNKNRQVQGGLYVSKNKGADWEQITTIPSHITSVNNVFVDRNNGYIYISCGDKASLDESAGGVWRSKDGGKRWERIFDAHYIWQCETSPVNPDIITVVSAGKRAWGQGTMIKNPGAYISFNGGKSWTKANRGLGQPDKITDFKPDPYDQKVFWCALWGSGWYKATWSE